jgi:alpha-1,6-mannosyltransferase
MMSLQIIDQRRTSNCQIQWLWITVGLILVGLHVAIMLQSPRFVSTDASDPSEIVVLLLCELAACGLYLIIVGTVRTHYLGRFHLAGIILVGVVLRLIMMQSTPVQGSDYYRYLWDGAVTANGISPYVYSPANILQNQISDEDVSPNLQQLAQKSEKILSRINHPHLRTIYPPVAQGVFAVAYWFTPFKILGWRIVLLVFDVIAVVLLLLMLRSAKFPLVYIVVYLWNPLLIYETHCRGHLDLIVGVLILLFIWALIRHHAVIAGTVLALAVGVKLWPLLLIPFLIFPLRRNRASMAKALGVFAGVSLLIMIPFAKAMVHSHDSGVVAYMQTWEANAGAYWAFNWLGLGVARIFANGVDGRILARGMVVLIVFIVSIWQARKTRNDPRQLPRRIGIVFILMLLLSPTVYPWYYVAVIPLAVLALRWTFLLWTLLLPISYFSNEIVNHNMLMLLTYIPIWLLWLRECMRNENTLAERQMINV